MYFEDLSPCCYHSGALDAANWAVPLRAVGWLEHPYPFTVGTAPTGLASRLLDLAQGIREALPGEAFRGLQECSLCRANGSPVVCIRDSHLNLIMPGDAEVFAAPVGVVHYITKHSYLPPANFITAATVCPDPRSPEYLQALRRANRGHDIPLRPDAEWKARMQAHDRFRRQLGMPVGQATRTQITVVARGVWPNASLGEGPNYIVLDDVRLTFDDAGRVLDIQPERRW